jgi:hypothetical protein
MYLQKVISRKNCVKKNWFFVGILKVSDENSRIRIQDLDPLVRGMDPRIRIHLKMSWIRNTALKGSHRMGYGWIFLKTFAPLFLIKTFE